MVKMWDIWIDKGIATTKRRLAKAEKNGMGLNIIKEKALLEKQKRHKKLREEAL